MALAVSLALALALAALAPARATTAAAVPPPYAYVSIEAFGAVGDNATDCTFAIRAALSAVAAGGGEVLVPAAGVYKTGPLNLTSNVRLRVEGVLFGLEDSSRFPAVAELPSYGNVLPPRNHPLVWAVHASNVSVVGGGIINGAGSYWWPNFFNGTARPHLMEMLNVTGFELAGVTLLNSAFWTLHPVYCRDVWIHGINITTPWCENYKCANTDGIDIDSTADAVVEDSYISCGDDHVTVISGANEFGRAFNMPSHNVTVRRNVLGLGMGLSIGSSVSGGVYDVVYEYNVMTELASDWGQGTHLKTQAARGGYVRNIVWQHSVFNVVSDAGLEIEVDYQGGKGGCDATNCTDMRDLVWRNLTFVKSGGGSLQCFGPRPCVNLTVDSVRFLDPSASWDCAHVASITVSADTTPPGLKAACGL